MPLELDTIICPFDHCRMDLRVRSVEDALVRARFDKVFFWHYFLLRCPHPGQRTFILNSEAACNCLACSNRFGKTTLLAGEHYHACIFKTGAEPRYVGSDGVVNVKHFLREKYRTVHTAGEWDQASEVWEDAITLWKDSPRLQAFVEEPPLSKPPYIQFNNGAKWLFRTLGVNASGIDGKNFYLLSIDEAGWIRDLERMMNNVLRIRVADVRGRIHLVGTFKPGMSKDFFKICVKSAARTGAQLTFDHRADDTEGDAGDLDPSIYRYSKELGFDLPAEIRRMRALDEAA